MSPRLASYWQADGFKYSAPANPTLRAKLAAQPLISGLPEHIALPAVRISVDVAPGYYDKLNGSWSLSSTKAQYAVMTLPPNNKGGNTFIYGHALMNIFGRLLDARAGDLAIVTTYNHHTFTYKLVNQYDIRPNDTSLFNYRGAPILTLQTCSGMWYQNRRILVFSLESVS